MTVRQFKTMGFSQFNTNMHKTHVRKGMVSFSLCVVLRNIPCHSLYSYDLMPSPTLRRSSFYKVELLGQKLCKRISSCTRQSSHSATFGRITNALNVHQRWSTRLALPTSPLTPSTSHSSLPHPWQISFSSELGPLPVLRTTRLD